jgi:uncharacterized protein (TIGR03437 family)
MQNRIIALSIGVLVCVTPHFGEIISATVGGGYTAPVPIAVAPGQVITLFVHGIGSNLSERVSADSVTPLPRSLAGISVSLTQATSVDPLPVPLLAAYPVKTCPSESRVPCAVLVGITAQIPFELTPNAPGSLSSRNSAVLVVSENGISGAAVGLNPVPDRIHVLNSCDTLSEADASSSCNAIVKHADGSLVTSSNPAQPQEILHMYAVGLGATTAVIESGRATTATTAEASLVGIGFDFRANAPPMRPVAGQAVARGTGPGRGAIPQQPPVSMSEPLSSGLLLGAVGVYQVTVQIAAIPSQTPACAGAVQSNLTITLVGQTSFDGAGICVSSDATPSQSRWDVRGKITKIVPADGAAKQKGIVGSFLVEGDVAPDTTVDKAAVTATVETRLFEQQGQDRRPSAFDSLKIGQTVQVRFAGPASQSYPVQATASEVVILQ